MTEIYGIFDEDTPGDREYSAAMLASIIAMFIRDGVVHAEEDELKVEASDPAAMTVEVPLGTAVIQGHYYQNHTANEVLTIDTADPTYARIDRVVLRLYFGAERRISAIVLKGTPGTSPVAPSLTRNSSYWDISLAQIAVGAGVTSIGSGDITDERGDTTLCGVASPKYVPSPQMSVTNDVNMNSHQLTGLPAPVGTTDATRKGYVDSAIAAAIAAFGISDITIDEDKNWSGKNIDNLGALSTLMYFAVAGDTTTKYHGLTSQVQLTWPSSGDYDLVATSPAMPAGYASCIEDQEFTISCDVKMYTADSGYIRIYVGDTLVLDSSTTSTTFETKTVDVNMKEGDVVTVYGKSTVTYMYFKDFKITCTETGQTVKLGAPDRAVPSWT